MELPVEHAKYRVWSNKHLPPNLKPAAHILSHTATGEGGREGGREGGGKKVKKWSVDSSI